MGPQAFGPIRDFQKTRVLVLFGGEHIKSPIFSELRRTMCLCYLTERIEQLKRDLVRSMKFYSK